MVASLGYPDMIMRYRLTVMASILAGVASPARAQTAAADSGDTGWMILGALLLLVAVLPGCALRFAGSVNVRNSLSVVAHTIAAIATLSLAWVIAGYSLVYAPGSAILGGTANLMLANLAALRDGLTVPESAFVLFQMACALLAGVLLVGAIAERTRMGWLLLFMPLWLLLVYVPITHALWAGGWLATLGGMDFAGGLVIHATVGFSALALVLVVGQRRSTPAVRHSPLLEASGLALVWIGLAGLVGGWAMGATDDAATAILNHHVATCAGALVWALVDRALTGKSGVSGVAAGALSAMAAVAASAALVGTGGALLIGATSALVGRLCIGVARRWIDDGGDIVVLHGIGGATGAMLLPIFALPFLGGVGFDPSITLTSALVSQLIAAIAVALWAMIGSAIAAFAVSIVIPMRVTEPAEAEGLDAAQHGQQAWDFR